MAAGGEVFLAGEGGRLAAPPGHPRATSPQGRRTNTAVIIGGGVEARGDWGVDIFFKKKSKIQMATREAILLTINSATKRESLFKLSCLCAGCFQFFQGLIPKHSQALNKYVTESNDGRSFAGAYYSPLQSCSPQQQSFHLLW